MHVGAHVARIDRPDPQLGFLDSEDPGELVLGSLGRAVATPARVAFDGGVGADQHHAAPVIRGSEQGQDFLDQTQAGHRVDLEEVAQSGQGEIGQRRQRARTEHTGVADQQVEASQRMRRAGERSAMLRIGDVAWNCQYMAAGRDQLPEATVGLLQEDRVAAVDDQRPAPAGQALAERPAQASGSPGHDCCAHAISLQ